MTRSLNELMFYGLLICYKQRELALLVIITESYNIDIYMYMEFDVTWTRPKQNTLSINFNMTTFVDVIENVVFSNKNLVKKLFY